VASSEQAARKQSIRITRALVEVLAERGFADATIGLVVRRAKVSPPPEDPWGASWLKARVQRIDALATSPGCWPSRAAAP
jgi:hypothetical protein